MSGGSLNYIGWRIDEGAHAMQREADECEGFSQSERDLIHQCVLVLKITGEIAHDIEWIIDADYGNDSFDTKVIPKLRELRDMLIEAKLGDSNG